MGRDRAVRAEPQRRDGRQRAGRGFVDAAHGRVGAHDGPFRVVAEQPLLVQAP